MSRKEEYWTLIQTLNETPAALDGAVDRARARARRSRAGRRFGIPLASLAGVAAAFVVLVNVSTPFAMACKSVPVIRELAEAVALEPSLKAALEHDYLQPVFQTQAKDGVTASVRYLIVDQNNLNVFYTLRSDGDTQLEAHPELLDSDGNRVDGYVATWGAPSQQDEEDYKLASFYFVDGHVPKALRLRLDIQDTGRGKEGLASATAIPTPAPTAPPGGPWHDAEPSHLPPALTTFTFGLTIDPNLLGPGRSIALDQWVELDGQRIRLESLTIDPTRMEFTLSEDPDNTALLKGLSCYAVDGLGNRYERPSVTYGGGETIQLESCYFSDSRDLTLCITGASWLDKDKTSFTLDLSTGKADWLPEGMVIESVERSGNNVYWALQPGDGVSLHWSYYDPEGGEHAWGGYSMSATDEDGDGWCERSTEYRTLLDYPWDTVTIVLTSNRSTEFAQPIQIPIK